MNNVVVVADVQRRREFLRFISIAPALGLFSACGGNGSEVIDVAAVDLLESPVGDVIVFEADDTSNPLHIFRTPITKRIQQLAFDLTLGVDGVLQKLQRFMDYIDQFRVGVASTATPDATAQERVGACGSYTGLFLAMARCLDIPGRYVNLYNWPIEDGHTVAEIFLDGDWVVFDPTYHVFYARANVINIPLSYEEIRSGYKNGDLIVAIGGNGRLGFDGFVGGDIFVNAIPQGVIGPSLPMLFPLKLDVSKSSSINSSDFTSKNQGAEYIGAAGVNIEQSWQLFGLEPGVEYVFRIVPDWIGGHITSDERFFEISSTYKEGGDQKRYDWNFDFRNGGALNFELRFFPRSNSVNIQINHPYRGPGFRYLKVIEYGVYRFDDPRLLQQPISNKASQLPYKSYAYPNI